MPPSFVEQVTRSREFGDQGGQSLALRNLDSSGLSAADLRTSQLTVIFDSANYKGRFVGSSSPAPIRRGVRM